MPWKDCMISKYNVIHFIQNFNTRDNKQIIKGFKGFDCTKTEQTNLLVRPHPKMV